ncbi:MAG: histidinol dehydrogenase [Verrucomicrobia bacterium]|nr:histidinol dehydrogenase [Verrucomicrobiota bacterium]
MKVLRHNQPDFDSALNTALAVNSLFDSVIEERTRAVINDVQARGDAAVLALTECFDKIKLTAAELRVSAPSQPATPALRKAIAVANKNIAAFARRGLPKPWTMRNAQGGRVGEKFDPIRRVGIYIPGGTAPLASTALMTITLAKVAGCPEIVACTPSANPDLLYAIKMAGATEIYRVGGAQAIAAMALGTATIPRVLKIFGPGNAYVTAAKKLLYGQVAVDLLAGPSEILVLSDDTADPRFIAADILAQAEHGSGEERVWLVTTSARVLDETPREIERQKSSVPRCELTERVLTKGAVFVLAKNLAQAVEITNRFAPEHLEVMTKNPAAVAKKLTTAGAIFLGPWTPTVVGDYVAGPSHTLPTGGAGAAFPGLTVDQFMRRTSLIEYTPAALKKSLPALEAFANVEGLIAHGASAAIRLAFMMSAEG